MHHAQAASPARNDGVSSSLDRTFRISLVLKGIDGALEVLGGLLFAVVRPDTLNRWVRSFTQHELSQDPHDFLARHLRHGAVSLVHGGSLFAAVYLLSHGAAKLVLVVELLRRRTWAYPGMIALLGAFIVYQCYRLAYRFGVGLAALTVFDAFVAWLTWREWRVVRRGRDEQAADRVRASPVGGGG